MSIEYKVGDRVNHNHYSDGMGTVVEVNSRDVGVDFDHHINGHDCNGAAKNGHGWYCAFEDVTLITRAEVVGSETTNPIFHYQASESLGEDAWKVLVKGITFHDGSWETTSEKFKEWEAEAPKPYPGAYRSAKSVIKGAINNSIPLLVESGEPRGKTAVQKDIKAAKEMSKYTFVAESPELKVAKAINKVWKFAKDSGKAEFFFNYINEMQKEERNERT